MNPALAKHLADLQTKALQTACLAEALNSIIDFKEHNDIAVPLIEKIKSMTQELNDSLDSTELGHVCAEGLS